VGLPCPGGSGTADTLWILASRAGSVENLKVSVRHGCSPHYRGYREIADTQLRG
jgi:hypothetical protein